MSLLKIIAIVLIVSGALGLFYESFTFRNEKNESRIGSAEFSVRENKADSILIWLGVGAIVVGGVIMLVENKKNEIQFSTMYVKKY